MSPGIRAEFADLFSQLNKQDRKIASLQHELRSSGAERVIELEAQLQRMTSSRGKHRRREAELREEVKRLKVK